jgi:hypothetical protein
MPVKSVILFGASIILVIKKKWQGTRSTKLPPEIQSTARRKLRMINGALFSNGLMDIHTKLKLLIIIKIYSHGKA